MSAALSLNEAVFTALTADGELMGLLAGRGVYSMVADQGAEYPFIVLGTDAETNGGALGHTGYRNELDVRIYSQAPQGQPVSKREALTIFKHVRRILHQVPLANEEFRFPIGRVDLLLTATEPDGRTVMAPATYRVQSWAI